MEAEKWEQFLILLQESAFIISFEDYFKWLALIKPLKCHSNFTSIEFLSTL